MALEVKELQLRVAGWYPGTAAQKQLEIDGTYGPKTRLAVSNFQAAHNLPVTGTVTPQTEAALAALHNTDNSTQHFDWLEFASPRDSSKTGRLPLPQLLYNGRLLMWALEGLRSRLGNVPIHINSGFRSIAYNTAIGGASDSMHMYFLAADISVRDHSPEAVANSAKRCGFSGIIVYPGHCHVDLRARIGRGFVWP